MLKTVGFPSTRTGDQTIVNGNLVIATAGKGVDFSATSHPAGMTSELLNDYEEGTWTPAFVTGTQTVTYVDQSGRYTKIGRQVYCSGVIQISSAATWGANNHLQMSGLPFAVPSYIQQIAFSYGGFYGENSMFQVGDITGAQPTGNNSTNFYLQRGQFGGTDTVYYKVSQLNTTGLVAFCLQYTV